MSAYSHVGDLTVIAICMVMVVLMFFSYMRSTHSFRVFVSIVGLLMVSALTNVSSHYLSPRPECAPLVATLRCVHHLSLFLIFVLFAVYIAEVTHLTRQERRPYIIASLVLFAIVGVANVYETVLVVTGHADMLDESFSRRVFMYGYISFIVLLGVLLYGIRYRLYRRVVLGFYGTIALSVFIFVVQGIYGQSSFTVSTYLYPVIAMFYVLHSSPYDVDLGAIDSREFESRVKYNYENKRDFIYVSLHVHGSREDDRELADHLLRLSHVLTDAGFKNSLLFQISKRHVILLFLKRSNPDFAERMDAVFQQMAAVPLTYGYGYRVVAGESLDEISRKNEYVSLVRMVQRTMGENSYHWVDEADVRRLNDEEYVAAELEDICRKRDLNDPRVLAYCQPVYNIRTGTYDTAEALMRLQLERTGMVYPDQFIPLAEERGYLHVLTLIILHKTCEAVRSLMAEGRAVTRISVNVSVPELKDDAFCDDIVGVIDQSGIPRDKIAIEITESQSEDDFVLMKRKVDELKDLGIKFYLDDFGTGYSNMQRIMELPFDIIKFDRSMVIASGDNDRSRRIVGSLASMFSHMNYSVLYEGIEGADDEEMCVGMDSSYLQGYKYSRPMPIDGLDKFFEPISDMERGHES